MRGFLIAAMLFLSTNACFAQSPSAFHDTWTVRDFYNNINAYLTNMQATGHHFYDTVRGLDSHIVTFNNDNENIMFVAEQNGLIAQIVVADMNEDRLKEKTLAALKVFGANVNKKDLTKAKQNGAVMVKGKDRNFIIRYEHPDSQVYILYSAK